MMKRKTNREIATAHGIAQIFKRGDNWNYTITLDIKKIPTDKRRLRRTLGYISADCVEEKVKLDIAKHIKKLKKGIYTATNPIKYIQTTYIPRIQEWTANNEETENGRGTWNPKKLRDDTGIINNYIIPFLQEHKMDWEDLTKPKAMIYFNRLLDKHNLSKSSKKKRRAVFNNIVEMAYVDELVEHKLDHPDLPRTKTVKGVKVSSWAFATEQMILDLLNYAEEKKEDKTGKAKTVWNREVCYHWFRILLDSGIRPFPNIPFTFEDLDQDGNTVCFWRNEKYLGEYKAQGGESAVEAFNALRLMYQRQGFEPIHILSDKEGNKAKNINRMLTRWLRGAGWAKTDSVGRPYVAHSIGKYHITTSCRLAGDGRESYKEIAERVGHSVKTLFEYYVEPFQRKYTRPRGLTQALTPNKKVITNISDYA